MTSHFDGKVGFVQRVLASYRVPFFETLADRCTGGFEVFAGKPRPDEGIATGDSLNSGRVVFGNNVHLGRGKAYMCWQSGLTGWLHRWNPDVLLVPANPRLLSTHPAVWMTRRRGRPVVGVGLGTLDWTNAGRLTDTWRRRLLARFYRGFDALVAYSTKGAEDYVRAGVQSKRVIVAHNAVSNTAAEELASRLKEQPDLVVRWRRETGLSDVPTLVFVGRLIFPKRVDLLIRTCAQLNFPCELLVVGEGPERSALERLAAEVFPSTRFLGHRTGQDLALALSAADLFVMPGTGGLAVHEAMIYGKPVIVGPSDGTQADLVQEGRNGYNVPDGDTNALKNAVERALSDPDRLQRMGLESRKIATEEVSLGAMVDAYVHALNLVGGRPALSAGEQAAQ